MTLSELAAFSISGSAATAASALLTDRISSNVVAPAKTTRTTAAAANGFVFFFSYYVAATARIRLSSRHHSPEGTLSTSYAASQAFLIGTTAAFCTRLLGPGDSVVSPSDVPPEDAPANAEDAETPPRHRWSLPALEDDLVLAVDPGLTFCIHEILARVVAERQWRQHASGPQRHINGLVAAAITFVLATTSKAIATGITYHLHTAAAAAEADRRRRWLGKPSEGDVGGDDADGHTVLSMLWKTVRHPGGLRALYANWLRTVATAALGHGLTMALHRTFYGSVLRLVYTVVGIVNARLADAPERVPPSSMQAQQGSLSGATEAPRAVPQLVETAAAHVDEQQKVTKAVESWLESTDATSTAAARETINADAPRLSPAPSTTSPTTAMSSHSWKEQLSEPWVDSLPPKQEGAPVPAPTVPAPAALAPAGTVSAPSVDEGALVRYEALRQNKTTAPPAQQAPTLDNVDGFTTDGTGNVVFNMISKSPRVVTQ